MKKIKEIKIHLVILFKLTIVICLGLPLYFTSKLIRSLSYLFIFKKKSAKSELEDFWVIKTDVEDF